MKQNKNFLNSLDDWGSVLVNTYEDSRSFKPAYTFDEEGRKIIVKEYSNVDIKPGKELLLDDDLYAIEQGAFKNCTELKGKLILPNSLTKIGDYAFRDCTGFTSLKLPRSLTSIGQGAFYGCTGFTGDLIIPESVTSIGHFAFDSCIGFTGDLIIPESVTSIGHFAFYYCNFNKIYVPKSNVYKWYPEWNEDCNAKIIKY